MVFPANAVRGGARAACTASAPQPGFCWRAVSSSRNSMHMPSLKTNSEARKGYRSAVRLNNLAAKYQSQGNASRPEKLYLRALQIKETLLGADHPDVAF